MHRQVLLSLVIAAALAGWSVDGRAAIASGNAVASPGAEADGGVIEAEFDRSMLAGAGHNTTDLSRFERGNPVLPGVYRVDIYLNNTFAGRSDVRFSAPRPDANAQPCVTADLLQLLNMSPEQLEPLQQAKLAAPESCTAFADLVPGGTLAFDQSQLRLDASIPQALLKTPPRGYVAPEYWDPGVSAFRLDYNLNTYRSHNDGQGQTFAYLGLNAGLNLGAWHLRQNATLTWQSAFAGHSSERHWQNIATYAQRDLPAWRAQLTVGDAYTSGELFDSVRLLGVRVSTDDRMLPESLRGYAPTVRGTAESNAKVTVRQNGVVIYQTTVAPGPFVIDDLYATSYGGDLQVSVAEADGRVRSFDVPYAAVPQLLRPGTTRFDTAVGQLDDALGDRSPWVVQATMQRGFSNLVTGYGGIVGSQGYAAAVLGTALNTRYGAFAVDVTGAHTQIPGQANLSGHSVRLSYSKVLPETDTSVTVATYRYSSSGYLGLRDALLARDYALGGRYPLADGLQSSNTADTRPDLLTPAQRSLLFGNRFALPGTTALNRQRSRFDLTLNQQLGLRAGSVHATASARDYWNRNDTDVQFQVGYNNRFRNLSYSLSASRARDFDGRYRNEYFLSFSLPLGESAHAPGFTGSIGRNQDSRWLEQATLSGSAGRDNQLSYGATASHGDDAGSAGSVYGAYRGSHAQLSASYGEGEHYSQASFGAAGTVVAYPGGVSFGQPAGDTVGIVVAPHAEGARVSSAPGVTVDGAGHALVPYLAPYSLNTVRLDPEGLPLGVQLQATSARVAPHAGAVVMLRFKTDSGRPLIVQVRMVDGRAAPFGAEVVDAQGQVLGVVGQSGRSLLRGVVDAGQLAVRWQDEAGAAKSCSFNYRLDEPRGKARTSQFRQMAVTCTAPDASARPGGSSS
ncbi:fimbria/pilus outer membrane usher protein [Frateuria hangzhouensis]|uniref:fimbria/pilus outer membrane usher protein n=1 Tax=Frateuria hangzhouensis TaxID=2995589 RepID=UPI002260C94F|nr:fimbria/pilus outer membrane usher protein [Frateuria sp. STR12]MCX7512608.1 fimbrial biogenesis outer membrane usher protein [Frateuria sp. STR12]